MAFVLGKDVIVAAYDSGTSSWVPYACATSCSLSLSTEFIETSELGSGDTYTYLPTRIGFNGNIDGLMVLNKPSTLAISDLRAKQLAKEKMLIRFLRTSTNGDTYSEQGYFYINESSDNGSNGELATFSVSLKGTGSLTQLFTPTPIAGKYMRYDYSGLGGETSFNAGDLIDKEVIEVVRDGIGFGPILTSGTPTGKQISFNAAIGSISFDTANPLALFEPVYVIYQ